jgi:hypothetical protein
VVEAKKRVVWVLGWAVCVKVSVEVRKVNAKVQNGEKISKNEKELIEKD